MPKLPVLSGRDVVRILGKVGYLPARQKGSHIILVRTDEGGNRHGVVVPDHKEIDIGTLAEIIRQAGLNRADFLKLVK